MSLRASNLIVFVGVFCCAVGCISWTAEKREEASSLPLPQMSPDSVVIEVAFVYAPAEDDDLYEAIWAEADEQQINLTARRQLESNGMRAGVLGSQLPRQLRMLLENQQEKAAAEQESLEGGTEEVTTQQRRIQCRPGKRAEIVAAGSQEDAVVLTNDDGEIRGDRYPEAQCTFAVRVYPQGDGSVKLDLTPEVQHGVAKMRWTGFEGTWKLDTSRERKSFNKLRIESILPPGHTLIISGNDKGLGKLFFAAKKGGTATGERRILLVRIAQTQHDDLFAPDRILAPIETPSD